MALMARNFPQTTFHSSTSSEAERGVADGTLGRAGILRPSPQTPPAMGPLAPAPRILCRPPGPEGHQAKHGAVLRVLTWGLLDNFKHRPIASVACELFSHFYMVGRNQEKSVGTHEPATEANGASRVCRGAASLPLQVPGKAQRRTGGSQESSLGPEHSTMGNGSQAGIQGWPAAAVYCLREPRRQGGAERHPHGDRRDAHTGTDAMPSRTRKRAALPTA